MKRHHPQDNTFNCGSGAGKSKIWDGARTQDAAGDDELLAGLGYKVKPSDMADVAEKIQHLDEVLGNDDELSLLASDSVHYNPSDLSSWLETMISTTQPPTIDDSFMNAVTGTPPTSVFADDLQAIPGDAMYPPAKKSKPLSSSSAFDNPNPIIILDSPEKKSKPSSSSSAFDDSNPVSILDSPGNKSKPSSSSTFDNPNQIVPVASEENGTRNSKPSSSSSALHNPNQIVLMDSQENGIRLVHTLMACAKAVEQENLELAETLVKQIGILVASQPGAMKKVATYFAEALARRIFRLNPENPQELPAFQEILEMHFYETCPYFKFAHFTANQAILEAFEGKNRVHVIDFSMKQGFQWPALMQALAVRPGGPPTFRLTGLGPPSEDGTDYLHEVGVKLAQFSETIHVKFEYRGFVVHSLADLEPAMLGLREGESVAVNSVFELHKLLARPGAVERVLSAVKDMSPEIVTVVEQEANHNGPVFLDRFTESLHYYSALFDSLDGGDGGGVSGATNHSKIMSEMYLGKQICNVNACEGRDRVERHELVTQWKTRFDSAGFKAAHLGSNAFKQASKLLAVFASGAGYRVQEKDGCLMLGWHTRPLIATSAWKVK